ncbi:MAG: molybdate ABC transporter permease subunit [Burkholderiaceae bacterium]|nr:molybdate ABC transporter permease subunit [Burkholderiaceae bacterium]
MSSSEFDSALIALGLTLKISLWATVINLILAVGLAYFFATRRFTFRNTFDAILTLPMVLPPTVLGYYLLVLLGRQGPVGDFLEHAFGIRLIFTWQGAVIAAAITSFPLVFKSARAAFESVSPQFRQAATSLGIHNFFIFFRVTLPHAWRSILAGTLLGFARSMGEFGATLMVAGSIPGQTQTLSITVYEAVQAGQDQLANFLVMLISIVGLLILVASNYLTPRGVKHAHV